MKTVDVLVKAREILTCGWTQGCFYEEVGFGCKNPCYCLMGAINAAADEDGQESNIPSRKNKAGRGAYKYIQRVLGIPYNLPSYIVGSWNDEPGRTFGEVLTAIDLAIANAKRRHINGKRFTAVTT